MTAFDEPVRLESRQKEQAAAVLRAAFLDDPSYVYLLADPDERARAITRFMDALLSFAIRYGEVYTTAEVRGVACWIPVRGSSASLWQLIRTGFALPRAVLSLPPESRRRMSDIMRHNDEVHESTLAEPHWYLGALAVSPHLQRRGIGSSLLRPVLSRADVEGKSCYVETQTPENVLFYERHGFELVHEGEVPGHPVRMWAMLRKPRTG